MRAFFKHMQFKGYSFVTQSHGVCQGVIDWYDIVSSGCPEKCRGIAVSYTVLKGGFFGHGGISEQIAKEYCAA